MNKYLSRKFIAATVAQITATVGLFTGHLSGAEWITATGLILGIHNLSNVANKRAQQ